MKTAKTVQAIICGVLLLNMNMQLQACKISAWRDCNPIPGPETYGWIDPDNFFWSVTYVSSHIIDCVVADEGQSDCSDPATTCCLKTMMYSPPDLTQGHTGIKCGNTENANHAKGDPCGGA